ncbi:MAG: hypothetical protein KF790_12225 [Steroidobacteraceae bacterium]|nr:hypothetical protein [Steroidobacteraceae bacterium]MCW5572797.1 hypothetical protein [Steroidobacteraceae bacterium]
MSQHDYPIPPERERQFDLIEVASNAMLRRARATGKPLESIYPVVPFVETDFSLDAWLFVDTESRVEEYRSDGTSDVLAAEFRAELERAGYPAEWLQRVSCHFGSKEVVDRDYEGSYFYFLR